MIKCLALWKDGPLYYDHDKYEYDRLQNKEVALCKSQNITDGFSFRSGYGISQNPDTKVYFIVVENNLFGNKIIDNLFNEMHFKVGSCDDVIFEWIQYNQFNDIKKLGKSGLYSEMVHYITTIDQNTKDYILILQDIYCEKCGIKYFFTDNEWREGGFAKRNQKEAALNVYIIRKISLRNLNGVRAYLIENYYDNNILNIYRISQHPETKDFIMMIVYIFRILGLCGDVVNTVGNEQITHSQAIYTSRLLNPFTKDLSRYNDDDELLECAIND
ncbi:kinase-like domain-containing protein [Rhizophagus clarus]|uniref:Kinase-like domain-containing protein n=1 Tax=Rhizophagus clarus TaxID=94130 RepID=A0A8H3QUZ3_9GLOM|nr:kinase-like domain-containing protein [Rhizophagus clarus]